MRKYRAKLWLAGTMSDLIIFDTTIFIKDLWTGRHL